MQVACGAGRLAVAAVAAVPVQQAAERRRAARLDVEELGDVRTKGELAGVKGSAGGILHQPAQGFLVG